MSSRRHSPEEPPLQEHWLRLAGLFHASRGDEDGSIEIGDGRATVVRWVKAGTGAGSEVLRLLDDAALFAASSQLDGAVVRGGEMRITFIDPRARGALVAHGAATTEPGGAGPGAAASVRADAEVLDVEGRVVAAGSARYARRDAGSTPPLGHA